MWPWEHLAFGYVCYALARHARTGRGPSGREAVLVALGTQLPDLVDKPLAWEFGLLPSGVSLAHSILVAAPVTAAAVLLARDRGSRLARTALGVGWLSHIAGDGLYPLLVDGEASVAYMLWPLVSTGGAPERTLQVVPRFWSSFLAFLGTPRGKLYATLEVAFLVFALGLWLWDGRPGLPRRRERSA